MPSHSATPELLQLLNSFLIHFAVGDGVAEGSFD
jgi:hypothetical protein